MKKDYIYMLVIVVLIAIVGFLVINNKNNSNSTTGTDSNNASTQDSKDNSTTNNNGKVEEVRYYQYYYELEEKLEPDENIWKSSEIELNSDGSARYYYGGNASGGADYKGTYTETDKNITLNLALETDGFKCDDDESINPCKMTITLEKTSDKLQESFLDPETNETVTSTYTKVEKSSLKLLK